MEQFKEPGRNPAGVRFCRQALHPLLGFSAIACLVSLVGWTGTVTDWQHWATAFTGLVFSFERGWVFRCLNPRGRERIRLLCHAVLAAIVFLVSITLLLMPHTGTGGWSVGWHMFIQISIVVSGLASMIHHQTRFTARAVHPGIVLIGSFLLIVLVGALLLKMPRCVAPGEKCTWLEALFTSTSAVCVTGLTIQNTATFFSHTGQVVILLLIQIGGLGIMTLTFFAAVVLAEGLSLHDRLLLGKMISENRLSRIGETLTFIVGMTFICEGVGAAVMFATLDGFPDVRTRLFHAVFHSISAFCNAGFSTLPDNMASTMVQGNLTWQICIMVLIVVGGLGSLVIEDLTQWAAIRIGRRFGKECPPRRLRTHTRLVLVATATLIFAGAAVIQTTEFMLHHGPENGGGVVTAFFHSITARTAGFNTVPMLQLSPHTVQMLMVLMLIGGSPGGTAGGMRTTVLAVGMGYLWNHLRMGRRGMLFFNRRIPQETGAQALGLMVLTAMWLMANFVILQMLQAGSGINGTRLLFELVSAFATVGLSLDLTPLLTDAAKSLLIVNMFVGRIGLLTVMSTLVPPDNRPASGKPTEDILLT